MNFFITASKTIATIAAVSLASPLYGADVQAMTASILEKVDAHPQKTRIEAAHYFNSRIVSGAQRKKTVSQNVEYLFAKFSQNDVDGVPGITDGDGEILSVRYKSKLRAQTLSRHLTADLNGDFQITEAELETYLIYEARQPIRSQGLSLTPSPRHIAAILDEKIEKAMRMDLNKDRVLTQDELVAAFEAKREKNAQQFNVPRLYRMFPPIGLVDLDGDQSVSDTEFTDFVSMVLNLADIDGNTFISRDERSAFSSAMRTIRRNNRD